MPNRQSDPLQQFALVDELLTRWLRERRALLASYTGIVVTLDGKPLIGANIFFAPMQDEADIGRKSRARTSIAVALVAVGIGMGLGVPLGLAAAARKGSLLDELIGRGNDLVFAFPSLLLAILIISSLVISIPITSLPYSHSSSACKKHDLWVIILHTSRLKT